MLGHSDFATTLIYADFQPSSREADLVDEAFRGTEIEVELVADRRAGRPSRRTVIGSKD